MSDKTPNGIVEQETLKTLAELNRASATAPESAKLLKRALRARFPGVRFGVRLDRGTAYGCCDVSWTDGPTSVQVQKVTGAFEGEGFDGMTDCSIHYDARLPDGRRSGLRMISENRRLSAAFARRLAALVAQEYGVTVEIVDRTDSYDGWAIADDTVPLPGFSNGGAVYRSTLLWREAQETPA